ncbi:DUF5789 family protein [Natronosalvus halobius]|uniref:DUF5789 family protein n=1 Tax=Natronosalvus halobius TaxID=2953746 RepID=UPI00209F83AD|nr:DUF5789 family protein [Natronosalvus halobius]USZ73273.1 DUF5789 family protein [Natronosalvus halobius]
MSDEEDDSTPAVELGEHTPVEGAPLARVTSRLHWPIQKSEIDRLEGDSEIRTPDGPRTISTVLEDVDETYFERHQEFEKHVRDVVGTGPVATADSGASAVDESTSSE